MDLGNDAADERGAPGCGNVKDIVEGYADVAFVFLWLLVSWLRWLV